MFGRRLHPRKMPPPPPLALFEVRPDQAAKQTPGYGDDPRAIRDASMNFIRSTIGKPDSMVASSTLAYG
jgi:hypothetical protein